MVWIYHIQSGTQGARERSITIITAIKTCHPFYRSLLATTSTTRGRYRAMQEDAVDVSRSLNLMIRRTRPLGIILSLRSLPPKRDFNKVDTSKGSPVLQSCQMGSWGIRKQPERPIVVLGNIARSRDSASRFARTDLYWIIGTLIESADMSDCILSFIRNCARPVLRKHH